MPSSVIRLFSTDLDGTILGNPEAAWRFTESWQSLPLARRPLLVYNTGRSVADTQAIITARQLPAPEFIIGSVGTELHNSIYNWGGDFLAQFGDDWRLEQIAEIVGAVPGVKRQPSPGASHPFKSSWFWARARPEELAALEQQLLAAGIQAAVIYSCRYFLDIVPARAGKGRALEWLCRRLAISTTEVLVAGDTANDSAMFMLEGVNGIVVENALPELLKVTNSKRTYIARRAMADGVLEGLAHFGILRDATSSVGEVSNVVRS
jgi:sucrose-6F-phosphate phosphohydrolase